MKQIERHRLNNNWEYAKKIWSVKREEFNLRGWKLRLTNSMSYLGLCDYNSKTISLSSVFMRGANCNYQKVKMTLLHEIAHILTPGQSHNNIWKKKCSQLGGDAKKAGSMNMPGKNWSVYCRTCKWRQEYYSKPNMTNRVCIRCHYQPRVRFIK